MIVAEQQRNKRLITISRAFDDLEKGKSFEGDSLIQYICVQFGTSIRTAKEYIKELELRKIIFEQDGFWEKNREVEWQG